MKQVWAAGTVMVYSLATVHLSSLAHLSASSSCPLRFIGLSLQVSQLLSPKSVGKASNDPKDLLYRPVPTFELSFGTIMTQIPTHTHRLMPQTHLSNWTPQLVCLLGGN